MLASKIMRKEEGHSIGFIESSKIINLLREKSSLMVPNDDIWEEVLNEICSRMDTYRRNVETQEGYRFVSPRNKALINFYNLDLRLALHTRKRVKGSVLETVFALDDNPQLIVRRELTGTPTETLFVMPGQKVSSQEWERFKQGLH